LYVRSVPQVDVNADVTNCLVYLENYIYYAGLSRKVSRKYPAVVSFLLFVIVKSFVQMNTADCSSIPKYLQLLKIYSDLKAILEVK